MLKSFLLNPAALPAAPPKPYPTCLLRLVLEPGSAPMLGNNELPDPSGYYLRSSQPMPVLAYSCSPVPIVPERLN